ncbi:MAG: CBS domain-containing protein [Candidatus Hadarchaeales archaeon]
MNLSPESGSPLERVSVREVMVPCPAFLEPRDPVTRARAVMRDGGIRVAPVAVGGRLEGIVRARDVMRVTSTRSNIPISGVMLPPLPLITPADSVGRAVSEMVEEGLREAPVVQSHTDRTVVGMIRLDEVLRLTAGSAAGSVRVSEAMTADVISCSPEDEISRVWDLMERGGISGIPVVRKDGGKMAVIGMVTVSDLIRSGAVRLSHESGKGRSASRVKSVMRTPVVTVQPDTLLSRAAEIMAEKRIGRLPVVSGGNLVGILSVSDVLRIMEGKQ